MRRRGRLRLVRRRGRLRLVRRVLVQALLLLRRHLRLVRLRGWLLRLLRLVLRRWLLRLLRLVRLRRWLVLVRLRLLVPKAVAVVTMATTTRAARAA